MTHAMLKKIEDIINNHKSKELRVNYTGWRVHKYNHHVMKEEYITSNNTKYFGIVKTIYIDIVPYDDDKDEVECAECHKMLSWTNSYPYFRTEHCYIDPDEVIYGSEIQKLLYCGKCKHMMREKDTMFEIRVRSNVDIDSFIHLPIKRISCTSISNINEVMNYAKIFHRDNSLYLRDAITCMILPDGRMPFDLRQQFIAKKVICIWKNIILRRKVAYVLYKCIPHIDRYSAITLGKLAVK